MDLMQTKYRNRLMLNKDTKKVITNIERLKSFKLDVIHLLPVDFKSFISLLDSSDAIRCTDGFELDGTKIKELRPLES